MTKNLLLELWSDNLTAAELVSVQRANTEEEMDSAVKALRHAMLKRVEVDILETFVGDIPDRMILGSGLGGGDCGVAFEDGETYLIEARPVRDEIWSTSICSRTGRIDSSQEDVKALRAWKEGRPLAARIYGYVHEGTTLQDSAESSSSGVAGVGLKLFGDDERREAVTDADGRFSFEDLASRVYRL